MSWSKVTTPVPAEYKFGGRPVTVFHRAEPETTVRVPACIGGRYDVEDVLAVGGMGAVLRAKDRQLNGRPVLIKIGLLDHSRWFPDEGIARAGINAKIEESRTRLEEEAYSLLDLVRYLDARIPTVSHLVRDYSAQLHGPHGETGWYWQDSRPEMDELLGQEPYLVMSRIEGQTVTELVRKHDPLLHPASPLARVRILYELGRDLSSLLAQLHDRQGAKDEEGKSVEKYLVYQDLKPDNVLCTPLADFFLIDFGTVREVTVRPNESGGEEHEFFSRAEGTPGFSAPETRESRVSEMSDLYSLGATLFYVLTEELPPIDGLAERVEEVRPQFPAELFSDLLDVISACVQQEPGTRRQAITARTQNRHRPPAEALRAYFGKLLMQN